MALLIIVLVITLPVIDFFRYPPDDNSLQSWTAQVYWSSKNFPDDTAFQVEKMREFYQILAYFPFQATFHYANMTQVIIEIENSQVPLLTGGGISSHFVCLVCEKTGFSQKEEISKMSCFLLVSL